MARTSRKREEAALTSVLEARDRPGLHGFEIDLSEAGLTAGRHVVTLRCADSGTELPGSPIILDVPTEPIGSGDTAGEPGPSNRTVGEGEGRAPAAQSQALATPMED